jgi:hypothetical protein
MDVMTFVRLQWDRIAAWVAIGAGAIFLLVGWFGVSGTVLPSEQLPYIISGGLGGFFLLGIGALLWISADLRDEWRKLDDLDKRWTELCAEPAPTGNGATDETVPVPDRRTRRQLAADRG